MVNINIREAEIKDLNTIKEFEQEIIKYERPFDPNLKQDPIEYYDLLNLIKRKDAQVVVATVDDEIVGSGYALIKNSLPYKKPEQYAYLGFMFVSPEFRGNSINGKIIESLMDWAKEKKITEIQLDVYAENKIALNAYIKRGFKPSLLTMRMNLEE